MAKKKTAPITRVRVADGDSLEVTYRGKRERVRLYGIDAPEMAQPYGQDCKEALEDMVRNSGPLLMEEMDRDHYGRIVGLVYPESKSRKKSLNLRMVKRGYAYAFTQHGGEELKVEQAERHAKRKKRGIWKDWWVPKVKPWDHRRADRGGKRAKNGCLALIALIVALYIAGLIGMWLGWPP